MEYRKLTPLLLDCWQREYDKRPYRCFKFDRLDLEKRLHRAYDATEDFNVIALFLGGRPLYSITLVGLPVPAENISLIEDFVLSLRNLEDIKLKLMDLPLKFFQLLAHNANNMKVKTLSLEGTALNGPKIDYLHSFIVNSTTLSKLNVPSCSVSQFNFAKVADAIYNAPILSNCNLSNLLGCHLTLDSEKVAHTVASLIWQNKLQELSLESCGFIGHDMETIAEYLCRQNSKLQLLNVSYNKIGANGVLVLLKAISTSGTLKHLKVNGCGLATYGGEVVAQYLSSCYNLESLAMQHNDVGAEAINLILLCMRKSCALHKLHLVGNRFNERTAATLRQLLDSKVLCQDNIDVTVTFDDTIAAHRVIPWLP